jgi:hypothetical protein
MTFNVRTKSDPLEAAPALRGVRGIGAAPGRVGIRAVMRYSIVRRTQKIAVRIALGATRRAVLIVVMNRGIACRVPATTAALANPVTAPRCE